MPNQSTTFRVGGKSDVERLVRKAAESGAVDRYKGKRNAARISNALALEVTTDPNDPSDVGGATMHDISQRGVAFWSKRQLPARTTAYLREFSSDNDCAWLAAQVTHCTVGIRGFLVGAEFITTPGSPPTPQPEHAPGNTAPKPVWRRPVG